VGDDDFDYRGLDVVIEREATHLPGWAHRVPGRLRDSSIRGPRPT
jgi:hypothetical protein